MPVSAEFLMHFSETLALNFALDVHEIFNARFLKPCPDFQCPFSRSSRYDLSRCQPFGISDKFNQTSQKIFNANILNPPMLGFGIWNFEKIFSANLPPAFHRLL